jgi:diadenosine tetraphosphate (Ap4A) HIT family hydrolase
MSTLFTKILNGEIPGRFVWREPDVSAFLTMGPLADGHTLVVPTEEVDRWTDASPETLARVMEVARRIGAVQVDTFGAARAGLIVAGYEINHMHVHVWPSNSMAEFNFATAEHNPDPATAGRQRRKAARRPARRRLRGVSCRGLRQESTSAIRAGSRLTDSGYRFPLAASWQVVFSPAESRQPVPGSLVPGSGGAVEW